MQVQFYRRLSNWNVTLAKRKYLLETCAAHGRKGKKGGVVGSEKLSAVGVEIRMSFSSRVVAVSLNQGRGY